MSQYAPGGFIPGGSGSLPVKVRRVDQTPNGECLYSINGGPPEVILTAAEAGRHARALLAKLNRWPGE